jgi:hypothetical protein
MFLVAGLLVNAGVEAASPDGQIAAAQGAVSAASRLLAEWVQYRPGGRAEARVATAGASCPLITLDGKAVTMHERATPDGAFPVRLCAAELPQGTASASVEGQALPLPAPAPRRIVVLGDSGCRIKYVLVQACNDPAQWPFSRVAASAAALKPDLVIHVGDYLYRETPCLFGLGGCTGSPSGDNWASWAADFFIPARPLLAAAPWVVVRGNHERCSRAGDGWTRLLGPARFDPKTPCVRHDEPYGVPLAGLTLLVLDTAIAPNNTYDGALLELYRRDFAALWSQASGPSWILSHHPIGGMLHGGKKRLLGGNLTLLPAAGQFPSEVELMLAGHIHTMQVINYPSRLPPQIIAGTGGDLLAEDFPSELPALKGPREPNGLGVAPGGFGFALLERGELGWRVGIYDQTGRERHSCVLHARRFACTPA